MILQRDKDPMGAAIADFYEHGKGGKLRVFSPMFEEEDGSFEIDLNAGYYGELEYQMQYKRIKGDAFPWLYIDFSTLQGYAEDNGWNAELVCTGDHYGYLYAEQRI